MQTKRLFFVLSLLSAVSMLLIASIASAAPITTTARHSQDADLARIQVASAALITPTPRPEGPSGPAVGEHSRWPFLAMVPLAAKDIKIAGVVFQDDQFTKSMLQGFKDAAKKAGVPDANVMIGNSSNDQAKETELINTYVSEGVNGFVIARLSPTVSMEAMKQANDKGVDVALINAGDFSAASFFADASFITGGYMSDNFANGTAMGEAAAAFIKANNMTGQIQVGMIDYDRQKPEESKLRSDGFEAGLMISGVDYKVVAHQSAEKQETALAAAADMLTANPGIQIIFACNEGGTIGAAQAVKQAGKKVVVFGFDGSDQLSRMIINGEVQAVIAQDPYGLGLTAMTDLINYLEGKGENGRTGELTIVPGLVLSITDKAAVNQWRVDHGLKELPIK
jgi:sugar transport system substrate-binding protein